MDQSKTRLYKNTLYVASGIFVFMMFAATTSNAHAESSTPRAVMTKSSPEVATLGRFVVTPTLTHFIAAPPIASIERLGNAPARGAL